MEILVRMRLEFVEPLGRQMQCVLGFPEVERDPRLQQAEAGDSAAQEQVMRERWLDACEPLSCLERTAPQAIDRCELVLDSRCSPN